MTMFEVGILVFLQIKKNYFNDEFEQSLEHSLEMSKNDIKYRETWDFLQITVSFIHINQRGKVIPIDNGKNQTISIAIHLNIV